MDKYSVLYLLLEVAMGLFQWHLLNQLSKKKKSKRNFKKDHFVVLANFYSVNTPTMVDFKPLAWHH